MTVNACSKNVYKILVVVFSLACEFADEITFVLFVRRQKN